MVINCLQVPLDSGSSGVGALIGRGQEIGKIKEDRKSAFVPQREMKMERDKSRRIGWRTGAQFEREIGR